MILKFTEADLAKLKATLARIEKQLQNTANRPAVVPDPVQAPDVLVVRVPSGGIAANSEEPGTGTGTGSISVGSGYVPSAECDVYQLTTENGYAELIETGNTETVHNLSTTAIAGDTWELAIQDRTGTWWVESDGGGSSAIAIGDPITGTPYSVLFIGTTGLLDEDNPGLTYDPATARQTITGTAPEVRIVSSVDGNHARWTRTNVDGRMVIRNTVAVPGETAWSLDFAGGNVSMGNVLGSLTGDKTLSAWIKTSGAGASYRTVLEKSLVLMFGLKDNVLMAYDWTSGDKSSGVTVNDGAWHHIALTVDADAVNGSALWLDGVQAGSSFTYATQIGGTNALRIGAESGSGASQQFQGLIDDVRIFNSTLTSGNIATLAAGGDVGSPVGHWKFNEGSGLSATDSGSGGNNGTLSGSVTYSSDVPASQPGTTPATDTDVEVAYSEDGTVAGEKGIHGWGNPEGRTYLHWSTSLRGMLGVGATEQWRCDDVGNWAFHHTAPAASVHVKARIASEPAAISQGTTTQVESIHQFRGVDGTVYAEFDADGDLIWNAQSSVQERPQFRITREFVVSTDASFTSRFVMSAKDWDDWREVLRGQSTGTAPAIGVLGAGAIVRQTITGDCAGNAALQNFLAAMATFGWITNSTTAGTAFAITTAVGGSQAGPVWTFQVEVGAAVAQPRFVSGGNVIELELPYAADAQEGIISNTGGTSGDQILGRGTKTVQNLGVQTTWGSSTDFDPILAATGSAAIMPTLVVQARDVAGQPYDGFSTVTGGILAAHYGYGALDGSFAPEDYVSASEHWMTYAYDDGTSMGLRTSFVGTGISADYEIISDYLVGIGTYYRWGYNPPLVASAPLTPGTGGLDYESHFYHILYTHLSVAGDIIAGGGLQLGPNNFPNYNERFSMWFGGGGDQNLHTERHGDHSVEHRLYTGPEFGAVGPGAYWFEYNGTDEGTGTGQTGYFRFVIGKLSGGDPEVTHSYFDGTLYWDGDFGTLADGSIVKAGLVVGIGNTIDGGTW